MLASTPGVATAMLPSFDHSGCHHTLLRESTALTAGCAGSGFHIVVPRSAARVRVHGFAPVIASPCSVLFLGPDDRIDRECLGDDRFIADVVTVPREAVVALRGFSAAGAAGGERFPLPWARLPAEPYLALRLLLRRNAEDQRAAALAAWSRWLLRHAVNDWKRRPVPAQSGIPAGERTRFSLAQDAAAHIEAHWQRSVSLGELSECFGRSSFHLLRAFRSVLGEPPHQYLLQLRLRRSLDTIEGGRQRIVDAASALGFCSHGHFSTAFRKVFGMSPVEFGGYRRCRPEKLPAP